MKVCYFDCFCGIAGDMSLAALADTGLELSVVEGILNELPIPKVRLSIESVRRQSLSAKLLKVEGTDDRDHRHLTDVLEIIASSSMTERAKARASAIYEALGAAEAIVHGTTKESVHFHEVGALDSIVDILGVAIATDLMDLERFYSTPIPLARGMVMTQHGELPLPAPATLRLMEGMPTRPQSFDGETVTPTGAANLRGLGCEFTELPPATLTAVGMGAGNKEFPRANVLRVVIADTSPSLRGSTESIGVVETNIDDMNPQLYGPLTERLQEAGAVDVFLTPVQMKKFRPGTLVTALAPVDRIEAVVDELLRHSTTIGCRVRVESRYCACRHIRSIDTPFGSLRVKVAEIGNEERANPEFEDAWALAKSAGVPVSAVLSAANALLAREA